MENVQRLFIRHRYYRQVRNTQVSGLGGYPYYTLTTNLELHLVPYLALCAIPRLNPYRELRFMAFFLIQETKFYSVINRCIYVQVS